MSPMNPDRRALLACLLLAAGTAAAASTAEGADVHLGVATCASSVCHGSAAPVAKGDVQQNEYVTWSRFDPHAVAWRTLSDERSVAIARRLGLPDATHARECLGCHSDDVASAARGGKFQASDGIGCEACHGGAANWLASHYDTPRVTHADNVRAGMRALDEPAARAAVCLRCHVGDGDRFASHRLMAAGHPRLAFELDTFTELWRTSGGREHFRRDADYARRKGVPDSPMVWSTGLVRQAQQVSALLRSHYGARGGLPDFALFDCYSCHRSMRLKEWRDRDAPAGAAPGSLRFDDSVFAMLSVALLPHAELRKRLDADVLGLQRAAAGPAAGVTVALDRLDGTLKDAERELAVAPVNSVQVPLLLRNLSADASRGRYADYAGAEQAAMGLSVLLAGAPADEPARSVLGKLFNSLQDDERYDARRFRELLQRLPGR